MLEEASSKGSHSEALKKLGLGSECGLCLFELSSQLSSSKQVPKKNSRQKES